MSPNIKIPKFVSAPISSRYDNRTDMGYGRTTDRLHKPRKAQSSFPYIDKDPYSDVFWEDEETEEAINKKTDTRFKIDSLSKNGTNSFYFSAGNIKLSDCFFRVDDVLEEINTLSKSMTPVPNLNSKKSVGAIGSSHSPVAISQKSYKRTGSKKGFSSSPPELKYDKNINDDTDVIFNLEDLVRKLENEIGNFHL